MEQKEFLSEFENISSKRNFNHIVSSLLFLVAIGILFVSYYSPLSELKLSSFYSDPSDIIFLLLLQLLPLAIFVLFLLKKKIGWVSVVFYCAVGLGLLIAGAFMVFLETGTLVLEDGLYCLLVTLATSALVCQPSVARQFDIKPNMFRYSLIISATIGLSILVTFIILSTNA